MSMDRTPPIEEQDYLSGVKVVQIEDLRVARGLTRRHVSSCKHKRLFYDERERRIWCGDCETDIDPFDAFEMLVARFAAHQSRLNQMQARINDATTFAVRSIAAKEMDKAWRSRSMVPACPHCGNGLFPEDFRTGPAMIGKDYAKAKQGRK